ncbi:hypothetical protein SETIT_8G169400v2 [Setaria italica]|uniref:TNFR-Cys domain-containing protein n=1 Tax=Setaria italica TaxID=4555 RepID=A0A368S8M7_SETIT|nr:hypothetical protein SETIT_8G169400v2 [Setaria italica]
MVSGAAGFRAAAAIAVLAVLVMSSQGHPSKKPLCSDCPSLCNTNCSAVVAAACAVDCSPPVGQCEGCKSQVLRGCCQSFCSSSNDTSTVSSCCPSDCISGDCGTCSCDNCSAAVQNNCAWPCSMHASDMMRCNACRYGAAEQCATSCISACDDHCVKKDC